MKRQVRERSGGDCERCHSATATSVHHLTYERIGHESLDDLTDVCKGCHAYLSGKIDDDPSSFPHAFAWVTPLRLSGDGAAIVEALGHLRSAVLALGALTISRGLFVELVGGGAEWADLYETVGRAYQDFENFDVDGDT